MKALHRVLWAALAAAVVFCPVKGVRTGEAVAAAPALPGTNVIIGGRLIRVTAELALDPATPIPEGPAVRLNAAIGIRTADPRGLPPGLALRSFRAISRKGSWSSPVIMYTTFAYDPQSQGGGASGGPLWEQGTRTNVIVEMTRAGRTHRVTVRNVPVGRLP